MLTRGNATRKIDGNSFRVSGIYALLNTVNGKRYIGQSADIRQREKRHFKDLCDKKHFNAHLQYAFLKYGLDKFRFQVLENVSINMLNAQEKKWINFYKTDQKEFGYNLSRGGELNFRGKHHSEETLRKMSKAHKGFKHSAETIKKIIESRKWYSPSEQTKQKISESWKYNMISQETLRRLHENRKGCPLSAEHRRKLSIGSRFNQFAKGYRHKEETRKKMSEAQRFNQKAKGHRHTKETREKMSKAHKGRPLSIETRRKMSLGHIGNGGGIPWSKYARKQHALAILKRKERSQACV